MQLIHIIGNICAGKTTFSKWLQKQIKDSVLISIDEYRIKYGDGSKLGEINAWQVLIDDIEIYLTENKTVIFESSGTAWRTKYFPLGLAIYINTPLQECRNRIEKRGKTNVPWPYGGNPVNSLQPIQEKIDQKVAYRQVHYPESIIITDNDHFHEVLQHRNFLNFVKPLAKQ